MTRGLHKPRHIYFHCWRTFLSVYTKRRGKLWDPLLSPTEYWQTKHSEAHQLQIKVLTCKTLYNMIGRIIQTARRLKGNSCSEVGAHPTSSCMSHRMTACPWTTLKQKPRLLTKDTSAHTSLGLVQWNTRITNTRTWEFCEKAKNQGRERTCKSSWPAMTGPGCPGQAWASRASCRAKVCLTGQQDKPQQLWHQRAHWK